MFKCQKFLLLAILISLGGLAFAENELIKTGCYTWKVTEGKTLINVAKAYIKADAGKVDVFFDTMRIPCTVKNNCYEGVAEDGNIKIHLYFTIDADHNITGYYERWSIDSDVKPKYDITIQEDTNPNAKTYWEKRITIMGKRPNKPLPRISTEMQNIIKQRAKTEDIGFDIKGKVIDSAGNPLEVVTVDLRTTKYDINNPLGTMTCKTKVITNKEGMFEAKDLFGHLLIISCHRKSTGSFSKSFSGKAEIEKMKDQLVEIKLEVKKKKAANNVADMSLPTAATAIREKTLSLKDKRQDGKFANFKLQNDVQKKLLAFLEHKDSVECRNDCLKAAEVLLKENNDDAVNSAFIYAKINWLLGEYPPAIDALNKIVKDYPQIETPVFKAPALIIAKFWLAAIMQEKGQPDLARQNYQDILDFAERDMKKYWGIAAITCFRLAEVTQNNNETKSSLEYLTQAQKIQCSPDQQQTLGTVISDWAAYNLTLQEKGVAAAQETLTQSKSKLNAFYLMPAVYLQMNGRIGNDDFSSRCEQPLFVQSLENVIEKSSSDIDKAFAAILWAQAYFQQQDYTNATKYFRTVYDGDSFWAPEAGLMLSDCFYKQGKQKNGSEIISDMKKRFPSYFVKQK